MITCPNGSSWARSWVIPGCLDRTLSIDISLTGELLDRKYAALAAQASQTEALRAVVGEERYREIIRVERFATFSSASGPAS